MESGLEPSQLGTHFLLAGCPFLFSKGRRRCSRQASPGLADRRISHKTLFFAAFSIDESDANGSNLFYTKQSVMMGRFSQGRGVFIETRRINESFQAVRQNPNTPSFPR